MPLSYHTSDATAHYVEIHVADSAPCAVFGSLCVPLVDEDDCTTDSCVTGVPAYVYDTFEAYAAPDSGDVADRVHVVCDDPGTRWLGADGSAACAPLADAWLDPDGGLGGTGDAALHVDNVTANAITVVWNASSLPAADYVYVSASLYVDAGRGSLAGITLLNALPPAPEEHAALAALQFRTHANASAMRLATSCGATAYLPYAHDAEWASVALLLDVALGAVHAYVNGVRVASAVDVSCDGALDASRVAGLALTGYLLASPGPTDLLDVRFDDVYVG